MQIFVRSFGSTYSIDETDPVAQIDRALSKRTALNVQELRYSHGGREIRSGEPIEGLRPGSTIDVNGRLAGGGPKKRCAFMVDPTTRCGSPSLGLIGECGKCEGKFCGRHRLPEDHACPKMDAFRQSAFQLNKDKLEAEAQAAAGNRHNVA